MSARMKDSGVEWLGRIPSHWDVVPPKALFTESKQRARDGDQLLSATQKYGVIPLADFEQLEQRQVTKANANLEMRKHVEVGDFVISMRSMDGGLERSRAVGSVRSSYTVLKPGPSVDGRFFGLLLKSDLYIQALRLTSNFIRDGQDLSFNHVRQVKLPLPRLEEQAAIAGYIGCATDRIDALVSKKTRFIELLREKRQALITHALTKGLDPNVPMKESGVVWLGKIPADWLVIRLKHALANNDGGVWGADPTGQGDTIVLRSTEQTVDGLWVIRDPAYRKLNRAERKAAALKAGDLLVTKSSGSSLHIGKTTLVDESVASLDCGFSNFMQRLRTNDLLLPELGWYLLNNVLVREQLIVESNSTTGLANLNATILGEVWIAVPGRSDQERLISHLKQVTSRIDSLIAKTERSIELLREHRTALITAAVTGKLDIPEPT